MCYVHDVSPLKKSGTDHKEFFECTLQFSNNSKKSLCFTPHKRRRLSDAALSKSPVKLANYNKAHGKVWINPPTTISLINKDDVAFEHNPALGNNVTVCFNDLRHLASGQLISVVAECHSVGEEFVHQAKQGPVNKQVALLRDPTHCVKLNLFGDAVSTLTAGETYLLKNLRLYVMKDAMFFNTTPSAPFIYEKTTAFEHLADPSVHSDIQIAAKIVGAGQFLTTCLCPDCNRKLEASGDLVNCAVCKMDYSPKATPCLYSLQLTVKDVATSDNVRVLFQNDAVRMLAKALSLDLNNEQSLIKRLFEVEEPLLIRFDFATKVVSSVKVAIES